MWSAAVDVVWAVELEPLVVSADLLLPPQPAASAASARTTASATLRCMPNPPRDVMQKVLREPVDRQPPVAARPGGTRPCSRASAGPRAALRGRGRSGRPAFWVTSSSIGRSKSSAPKSSARNASSFCVSTEVRTCLTLSRKIRESAMWRRYSARRDLAAAERGAVRLVRPAEEREEPVVAVAEALVLEVARALQMLEPLVERLVEADHHRRRRLHPALDDRALRLEVLAHRVLELGVPLAEVLGEDLAAAAGDPVHAGVAQPRGRLGVA